MKRRIDAIVKALAKVGFTVSGGSYDFEMYSKNHDVIVTFNYDRAEFKFCCGVKEIGDVYVDFEGKKPKDAFIKMFLQYVFLKLKYHAYYDHKNKKLKKVVPQVYCSNGVGDCVYIEKALKGLKSDYKVVSKSINPGSGNTITIFISK